jgi:hypothetical protein
VSREDLEKSMQRFTRLSEKCTRLIAQDPDNAQYYEILAEHYSRQCQALRLSLGGLERQPASQPDWML